MTPADRHRVELTFDDGVYAKLICPESGCVPALACAFCGLSIEEAAEDGVEKCYDCPEPPVSDECWVKTWFDNCMATELLAGSVTVEVDPEWANESLTARIVPAVDPVRQPAGELRDEAIIGTDGTRWVLLSSAEAAVRREGEALREAGDGAALIADERRRQINDEDWSAAHDDEHDDGQLARAAAVYATTAGSGPRNHDTWVTSTGRPIAPYGWPWEDRWFKPTDDPIRDLTKAGALIAAEIDRLRRAALAGEGDTA